jgi:hypothetical protein
MPSEQYERDKRESLDAGRLTGFQAVCVSAFFTALIFLPEIVNYLW